MMSFILFAQAVTTPIVQAAAATPVAAPLDVTEYWRNIATVVAAVIATSAFVYNTFANRRKRLTDNLCRYIELQNSLFTAGRFCYENWVAIEGNAFVRNLGEAPQQKQWNEMLGTLEHIALLKNRGAATDTDDIYLFGWWAQKLQPMVTAAERNNIYWELAVQYLDDLKDKADAFGLLTRPQRERYHKNGKFPKRFNFL